MQKGSPYTPVQRRVALKKGKKAQKRKGNAWGEKQQREIERTGWPNTPRVAVCAMRGGCYRGESKNTRKKKKSAALERFSLDYGNLTGGKR